MGKGKTNTAGSLEKIPDARHRIGRLKELAGMNGDKKKQGSLSLTDIQDDVINNSLEPRHIRESDNRKTKHIPVNPLLLFTFLII